MQTEILKKIAIMWDDYIVQMDMGPIAVLGKVPNKILIIGDKKHRHEQIKNNLDSRGDYIIRHSLTYEDGLKSFRSFVPQLVIIDLDVDLYNGYELGKKMEFLCQVLPSFLFISKSKVRLDENKKGFKFADAHHLNSPYTYSQFHEMVADVFLSRKKFLKDRKIA